MENNGTIKTKSSNNTNLKREIIRNVSGIKKAKQLTFSPLNRATHESSSIEDDIEFLYGKIE